MKILHVTIGLPPYTFGGLPIYVNDLINEQNMLGHKVYVMEPGQFKRPYNKIMIKKKKKNGIQIYDIINPLPVSSIFGIRTPKEYMRQIDKEVYRDFLKQIKPDIIHIHSFMGLHMEFFKVAKELKIPILMTTHDYFGLCLRGTFINEQNKVCNSRTKENCAKCNYNKGLTLTKIYIMQSEIYKKIKNIRLIKKIRQIGRTNTFEKSEIIIGEKQINDYAKLMEYYYKIYQFIDYYHYNSDVSKQIYETNLKDIKGTIIPLTLKDVKDQREIYNKSKNDILKIGYIGRKEQYKGIELFINTILKIEEKWENFECLLYGDNFKEYESKSEKIHNGGIYTRKEKESILKQLDLLVIPSIWNETYGFAVLEALSYGVPVIVTKQVGSKILIENCPIKVITKANEEDLYKTIEQFLKDNDKLKEYKSWINTLDSEIFDMDYHTEKILELYKGISDGKL